MTVPYLTEERMRVMGVADVSDDFSDVQVASAIMAASAKVDAYCNVPKLPQPYSFRGGAIVDEYQTWNPGNELTQPQRTLWLRHKPVKVVSSLRIYVTPTQYTNFDVGELFVNRDLGCVDIVSLAMTSTGLFGAFIVPNIGLQRPQARVSYTYGYDLTAVDEILQPTDAQLYRAFNQFWDASVVTVKVNGTEASAGDYTIDRLEGTIAFDDAQAADALVTASYGYTLPHEIAIGTALIAHDMLTESELHDRGLGNLESLKVGEISMTRGRNFNMLVPNMPLIRIAPDAEGYLAPYRFVTVR